MPVPSCPRAAGCCTVGMPRAPTAFMTGCTALLCARCMDIKGMVGDHACAEASSVVSMSTKNVGRTLHRGNTRDRRPVAHLQFYAQGYAPLRRSLRKLSLECRFGGNITWYPAGAFVGFLRTLPPSDRHNQPLRPATITIEQYAVVGAGVGAQRRFRDTHGPRPSGRRCCARGPDSSILSAHHPSLAARFTRQGWIGQRACASVTQWASLDSGRLELGPVRDVSSNCDSCCDRCREPRWRRQCQTPQETHGG